MTEKPDYSGMTINERLFAAGLMGDFDRASHAQDRERMITILALVQAPDPAWTVDAMLAEPVKYGLSRPRLPKT